MAATNPPKWSDEELKKNRDLSEARFVLERKGEGPAAFYSAWDRVGPRVAEALETTDYLRDISGKALIEQKGLWQTLRYFCAPPISEEDLWTLVGQKFANVREAFADDTAAAFSAVLDGRRFPWVALGRGPTPEELSHAKLATIVLMSHEALKTDRRGASSKAQEEEVSAALVNAGMTLDPARTPILRLDELNRGTFSRERRVAGAKCDIPIRLNDGRLLALECKVSNGPKNGWKRLQREVGGKSDTWRRDFGSQVLTGAVLAGVFDLSCVQKAQNEQDVFIFWQHDLEPLVQFVRDDSV